MIGISSAAVQYINIHVIVIYKNINNLKYVRHYGWGQLYNAASLVTQTIRAASMHLSITFLLMQDHMQRENNPI